MSPADDQQRLLYFGNVDEGGLSQYAAFQAAAIARLGCEVVFLGKPHMPALLAQHDVAVEFIELPDDTRSGTRLSKLFQFFSQRRREVNILADVVREKNISRVLMASYFEYFSPVWIGGLKRLAKSGVQFGTIVHDPVRDFQVGPSWWHQYCISTAYGPIDVAFVHNDCTPDWGWPSRPVQTATIPHGPYFVPASDDRERRARVRGNLGIPEHAVVVLSFGHIRDNKNLDLLISSLVDLPEHHLLVVGREQSTAQRTVVAYQQHASNLGVDARCHWINEFVPDDKVQDYFEASDITALVYDESFQSASGVLSLASQFELPVVASSGGGPLRQIIEKHDIGIWIPPSNVAEITRAVSELSGERQSDLNTGWQAYRSENCWELNAEVLLSNLFC